jgi:hypothetical protein
VIAFGIYFFFKCLEGYDTKKTGLSQNSASVAESKANNVFLFQLKPSKSEIYLPNGKTIRLKEAWVESGWSYESGSLCRVYLKKKDYKNLVFLLDNYSFEDSQLYSFRDSLEHFFGLWPTNKGQLSRVFIAIGDENNFKYFLYNDRNIIIDTLSFYK